METFTCPSNSTYDDVDYRMKWVHEILQSTKDCDRTFMDFPCYYGTGGDEVVGCVADDNYGDDLTETVDDNNAGEHLSQIVEGNNAGGDLFDTVDDELVTDVSDSGGVEDVGDEVDGKFPGNFPNHNGGDELVKDVGDQEDDKLDGNVGDNNDSGENHFKRRKSRLVMHHSDKYTDKEVVASQKVDEEILTIVQVECSEDEQP